MAYPVLTPNLKVRGSRLCAVSRPGANWINLLSWHRTIPSLIVEITGPEIYKLGLVVLTPGGILNQGMQAALAAGAKHVAIFGAASEAFSQRNLNCSIAESLKRFEEVMRLTRDNNVAVRG